MTAPTGDFRDRLAAALPEELGPVGLRHRAVPALGEPGGLTGYGDALLAVLLPVVESYGRACAATALRDAGRRLNLYGDVEVAASLRTWAEAAEAGR